MSDMQITFTRDSSVVMKSYSNTASFFLYFAAGCCLCTPLSEAQSANTAQDDETIDMIVVVANKSERSVREIAANVTIMTRSDISDNLAATVADVFRYTPGIDYEAAGSRFGTEGINIRGIGGNRVALLVDGVPLSDQFDVGGFSNATRDFVNAGLIQRVEVLHGPASALYGSAAVGGVVAITTPDPANIIGQNKTGGDFTATWRAADSSSHAAGMFAFGDNSKGLLFGASLRSGQEVQSAAVEEILDFRNYERRSAIVKFVADDRFGKTWRVGFIHQDSQVTSDLNSMLGTGRFRSTTALEGDDDYTLDLISAEYEFGSPGEWVDSGVVRGYYETAQIRQKTLDERGLSSRPVSIDRFFSFDQEIHGFEVNLQKQLDGDYVTQKLGAGIEYRERKTTEYRDGTSTSLVDGSSTNVILGEVFPLRDFPISTSAEWSAYFEDVMTLGDWSLIGAVRLDRYELTPSNDPMFAEDYPFAELVSITESDLSPKLGVIYRVTEDTDIYLQYSHGFRAPPYADANIGLDIPVFNYRAIPNPDLRSETSDGFDLGVRWHGDNSSARLAVFRTRYTDFIESKMRVGIDPVSGRLLIQSRNISATVIAGIEAGGHVDLAGALNNFQLDGSLYVAQSENRDNGQPLNSVGPGQLVVGASWNAADGKRRIRLQTTFTDAWDDRDESRGELFKPAGHVVFDLYLTQRIGEQMTLRAGLMNLTDRTYWNWSDVRGLGPNDPALPYLAQAGRSVSLSLNVNWQ